VIIGAVVDATGKVIQRSVQVLQSVQTELDEESVRYVKQAVFFPACRDGRPVKVRVAIPIDFKITYGG
jgi:TonB family protein